MDESVWRRQWWGAQTTLHGWTDDLNRKCAEIKYNAKAVSCVVDAVDLDEIDRLSRTHQHVYVISEHIVDNQWPNVSVHQLPYDFYGAYLLSESADQSIVKDFNCFINRTDPIRQTWFYLIYRRGWLDRSYTSFNMHQRPGQWYPDKCRYKTFDHYHDVYLQSFDDIKDDIKKLVPFRNFEDKNDLCGVILQTKFSIIIETYFEREDCQTFTEKTWRALQLPRPWLLFAAKNCVQKLRDMGFDVFDDYVNHDYDLHDTKYTCVDRQESMLQQAERLFDLEITPDILKDWQEKSNHNRQIIQRWAASWHDKCRGPFDQIMSSINLQR